MKKIISLLFVLTIFVPVSAYAGSDSPIQDGVRSWLKLLEKYFNDVAGSENMTQPQNDTVADSSIEFLIKNRVLYINGRILHSPWDLDTVVKSIGEYDRVSDLANTIYTYDNKGIILYEPPSSSRVSEISCAFVKESYDFSARTPFTGKFMIDTISYSEKTSIEEVKKNLSKYRIEKAFGDSYRVSLNGIYVYFNYDSSTNMLVSVSFGIEQ